MVKGGVGPQIPACLVTVPAICQVLLTSSHGHTSGQSPAVTEAALLACQFGHVGSKSNDAAFTSSRHSEEIEFHVARVFRGTRQQERERGGGGGGKKGITLIQRNS